MVGVKFFTFALVLVLLAHGSMAMTVGLGSTGRNMTGVVKAVDALKKACEPSWTASFPAKLAACRLAQGKTKKLCPQECGAFFSSVSGGECKVAVTEGARFVWPKNYKKIFQLCSFGEFSMFSKAQDYWVAVGDPKSSEVASAAIGALSKACGPSIAAISVPFAACVAATEKKMKTFPKSCQMMMSVLQTVSKNCKMAVVETAIAIVPHSYNKIFFGFVGSPTAVYVPSDEITN